MKRLMLAFGSLVLAILTMGLSAIPSVARSGMKTVEPMLEMLVVYFMFAVPGLFLVAPFVLLLKDARGWRLWATLLVGVAIGPTFIVIWVMSEGHAINWLQDGMAIISSVVIGVLTTGLYVGFLRWFGRTKGMKVVGEG